MFVKPYFFRLSHAMTNLHGNKITQLLIPVMNVQYVQQESNRVVIRMNNGEQYLANVRDVSLNDIAQSICTVEELQYNPPTEAG